MFFNNYGTNFAEYINSSNKNNSTTEIAFFSDNEDHIEETFVSFIQVLEKDIEQRIEISSLVATEEQQPSISQKYINSLEQQNTQQEQLASQNNEVILNHQDKIIEVTNTPETLSFNTFSVTQKTLGEIQEIQGISEQFKKAQEKNFDIINIEIKAPAQKIAIPFKSETEKLQEIQIEQKKQEKKLQTEQQAEQEAEQEEQEQPTDQQAETNHQPEIVKPNIYLSVDGKNGTFDIANITTNFAHIIDGITFSIEANQDNYLEDSTENLTNLSNNFLYNKDNVSYIDYISNIDSYVSFNTTFSAVSVVSGLVANITEGQTTVSSIVSNLTNVGFVGDSGTGSANYGTYSVSEIGFWIYIPDIIKFDSLAEGEMVQDSFSVTTSDGKTETITINLIGVNDPAIITGDNSGSLIEDDSVTTSVFGNLSVNDVDTNQSRFNVLTDETSTYGTFSITEDGAWQYQLDNNKSQSLNVSGITTEEIKVTSVDGTEHLITIFLSGVNDVATITGFNDKTISLNDNIIKIANDVVIEDVDDANLNNVTIQITNYNNTEDLFYFEDQVITLTNNETSLENTGFNYIATEDSSTQLTITITGDKTIAEYQSLVSSFSYNKSNTTNPDTTTKNITITVDQGIANEAQIVANLIITALTTSENTTSNPADDTTTLFTAQEPEIDSISKTYEITSVMDKQENDVVGLFEIDANTGEVSLVTGQNFDYETAQRYDITINVKDQNGNILQTQNYVFNITDLDDGNFAFIETNYLESNSANIISAYNFENSVTGGISNNLVDDIAHKSSDVNEKDGTIGTGANSGVTATDNSKGNFLSLDGTNTANLSLGNITLSNEFSLSGWFKFNQDDTNSNEYLFSATTENGGSFSIYRTANDHSIIFLYRESHSNNATDDYIIINNIIDTSATTNEFDHYSFTMKSIIKDDRDAINVSAYVNGILNMSEIVFSAGGNLTLAGDYSNAEIGNVLDGGVDDVILSNTALSIVEIRSLYEDTLNDVDKTYKVSLLTNQNAEIFQAIASNPESGTITYSLTVDSISDTGLATTLSGTDIPFNIDSSTGIVTKNNNTLGSSDRGYIVRVTAIDGSGNSDTQNYLIEANIRATITGTESGNLAEDNVVTNTAGQLFSQDDDNDDNKFTVVTDGQATYGTYSIDENGNWIYDLDSTLSQTLNVAGDTDTFIVNSVDGTSHTITINLSGTNDLPTITNFSNQTISLNDQTIDITKDVVISDIDNNNLSSITIKIDNYDSVKDSFYLLTGEQKIQLPSGAVALGTTGFAYSSSISGNELSITIVSADSSNLKTVAEYQDIVRTLAYKNDNLVTADNVNKNVTIIATEAIITNLNQTIANIKIEHPQIVENISDETDLFTVPDQGTGFSYSISTVSDKQGNNVTNDGLFSIDANTGLVKLVAGKSLDYETSRSYTIEIGVNNGTSTELQNYLLKVVDVDDGDLGAIEIYFLNNSSAIIGAYNFETAVIGLNDSSNNPDANIDDIAHNDNDSNVLNGKIGSGANSGTSTGTTANRGNYLALDGSDNSSELSLGEVTYGNEFSLSGWFRFDENDITTNNYLFSSSNSTDNSNDGFTIYREHNNDHRIILLYNNSDNTIKDFIIFNNVIDIDTSVDAEFHHYSWTLNDITVNNLDAISVSLYVDGIFSTTGILSDTDGDLTLAGTRYNTTIGGKAYYNNDYSIEGGVDELILSNTAFSVVENRALYEDALTDISEISRFRSDIAQGSLILEAVASNAEAGSIEYSFTIESISKTGTTTMLSESKNPFILDSVTGLVTRGANQLDTAHYGYVLRVTATDGSGNEINQNYVIDVNHLAIITGDDNLSMTEDDSQVIGTLTSFDADGNSEFTVSSGTTSYGSYSILANGQWTYTLNNSSVQILNLGNATDSFIISAVDNSTHEVNITIEGVNDPATIGGQDTGSINEDVIPNTVTGTLTSTDIDNTIPNKFIASSGTTTYGTYIIDLNGNWTYTLNNSLVQDLNSGRGTTDIFTIQSIDNTEHQVTINIDGENDVAAISSFSSTTLTINENYINIAANVIITDIDDNNLSNITITIANYKSVEDQFSIMSEDIDITTDHVLYSSTGAAIGTTGFYYKTSRTDDELTIILSSNDTKTIEEYQEILQSLSYNNSSQVNPDLTSRVITLIVDEGTSNETQINTNININILSALENVSASNTLFTVGETGTYSITAVTDSESVDKLSSFEINSSGEVSLVASNNLNYETARNFDFDINVTANGTTTNHNYFLYVTDVDDGSFAHIVTTDINDVTNKTIAGEIILQALASNPVSGTTISYSISVVETSTASTTTTLTSINNPFSINEDTGIITRNNVILNSDADSYNITVTATEKNSDGSNGNAVTQNYAVDLDYSATITGTNTDNTLIEDDSSNSVSYQLSANDPDNTPTDTFTASSGTITYGTYSILTNGTWTYTLSDTLDDSLNIEGGTDNFTIYSDGGTPHGIFITLTGSNDVLSIDNVVNSTIEKNHPTSDFTNIASNINITDPDNIFTSLTIDVSGYKLMEDLFSLNNQTLVETDTAIALGTNFAYTTSRTGNNLTITITSTDQTAIQYQTLIRTLSYNNSKETYPDLNTRSITITANEGDDTSLVQTFNFDIDIDVISASEALSDSSTAIFTVSDTGTYAINSVRDGLGNNIAGLFEIDSSTGEVSLVSGQTLDYETAKDYSLDIAVTDSGVTTNSDYIVYIEDIDDGNLGFIEKTNYLNDNEQIFSAYDFEDAVTGNSSTATVDDIANDEGSNAEHDAAIGVGANSGISTGETANRGNYLELNRSSSSSELSVGEITYGNEFTFSSWLRFDDDRVYHDLDTSTPEDNDAPNDIFFSSNVGNENKISIYRDNITLNQIIVQVGNAASGENSYIRIPDGIKIDDGDNQFHHYSFVLEHRDISTGYDGIDVTLYIDGRESFTTVGKAVNSGILYIFGHNLTLAGTREYTSIGGNALNNNSSRNIDGAVDEVLLSHKALSVVENRVLYENNIENIYEIRNIKSSIEEGTEIITAEVSNPGSGDITYSYTIQSVNNNGNLSNVTISNSPFTIDANTGIISKNDNSLISNAKGYFLTVTAIDGSNNSIIKDYVIEVISGNTAPIISSFDSSEIDISDDGANIFSDIQILDQDVGDEITTATIRITGYDSGNDSYYFILGSNLVENATAETDTGISGVTYQESSNVANQLVITLTASSTASLQHALQNFSSSIGSSDTNSNNITLTINDGDDNSVAVDRDVVAPIVLDLDGDGIEYINISENNVLFDVDNDGELEKTAWVGEDDGLLVYDYDRDGLINKADEISFVGYRQGAKTDLEGLLAFDSNDDKKLDSSDKKWLDFKVWKDANQDGITDEGELLTLEQLNIKEISLISDKNYQEIGDVIEYGRASYTLTDGTTYQLGDAGFVFENQEEEIEDILENYHNEEEDYYNKEEINTEENSLAEYQAEEFLDDIAIITQAMSIDNQ